MNTKTKEKLAMPKFVRIAIDDRLAQEIQTIQAMYPLLSVAEATKLILSRGVKTNTIEKSFKEILKDFKDTNPIKQNLTEEQMFLEYERFIKEG